MEKEIIKTVKYFSHFSYAPSFNEIYTFLALKTTKAKLSKTLKALVNKKKLLTMNFKLSTTLYTLGEYSINTCKIQNAKFKISQEKLKIIRFYIKVLALFPQIKLVGLSGSIAMMNASRKDDIDLFIISSKNRLWTARFIAILCANILGLRRKRGEKKAKDKVCLNLFFDEKDLKVPGYKKNLYVAHEVLQVRPLINKDYIYERFLKVNNWVFDIFPNARFVISNLSEVEGEKSSLPAGRQALASYGLRPRSLTSVGMTLLNFFNIVESLLKRLQLNIIKQHQTSEIVTDTQLWFFPDDFEKKLDLKAF